jgi:chromosome segregation ATPase
MPQPPQDVPKQTTSSTTSGGIAFSTHYRFSNTVTEFPDSHDHGPHGRRHHRHHEHHCYSSGTTTFDSLAKVMIEILEDDYKISPNSCSNSSTSTFDVLSCVAQAAKDSDVITRVQTPHPIEEQILITEAFEERYRDLIFILAELKRIKSELEEELAENIIVVGKLTCELEKLENKSDVLAEQLDKAKQVSNELKASINLLEGKISIIEETMHCAKKKIKELLAEIHVEEKQLVQLGELKDRLKAQIDNKVAENLLEIALLEEARALLEKYRHEKAEKLKCIAAKLEQVEQDRKIFAEKSVCVERKVLHQISTYSKDIAKQEAELQELHEAKKELSKDKTKKEELILLLNAEIDDLKVLIPTEGKLQEEKSQRLKSCLAQEIILLAQLEELEKRDSRFDERVAKLRGEVECLTKHLEELLVKSAENKLKNDHLMAEYRHHIHILEQENRKLKLTLHQLEELEALQQQALKDVCQLEGELDS